MKTFYLLAVILALSSCAIFNKPTTHVPTMPNEPMFTDGLQAQGTAGFSFDHTEVQAAVSIVPFLGFTANHYRGIKGIKESEYGINIFAPLNGKRKLFLSCSGGKGSGVFSGKYNTESAIFGMAQGYELDTRFNSFYIQPSIYYLISDGRGSPILKVGLGFKHEEIFFQKFNVGFYSSSGQDYYTYSYYNSTTNGYSIIETTFLSFALENETSPLYINGQIGLRNVKRKFTSQFQKATGNAYPPNDPLNNLYSPAFNPLMINLTVGMKIDYKKIKRWLK